PEAQMCWHSRQNGCVVNAQRFQIVEMPAWSLPGGTAGMENRGPGFWVKAREFQFLKGRRWHCRNLAPIRRSASARSANPLVGGVVPRLKLEKLHRKAFECLGLPSVLP